MELTYYGGGTLLIATKHLKILVDPPDAKSGIKLPKLKPDAILSTNIDAKVSEGNADLIINSPGEYEIKGVSIQGVQAKAHADDPKDPPKAVMYVVETADTRLLITGNVAGELDESQRESIGEVYGLVVPVGGHGLTLDGAAAAQLVSQIEPSLVIPVHYNDGKTKYPIPQDKVDQFLHAVGAEAASPEAKLKITAGEPGGDTKVALLQVSS